MGVLRDVRVGKAQGDPTYTVIVGRDVYEMDERPDLPNGVCIYSGSLDDKATAQRARWVVRANAVPKAAWPEGLARKVRQMELDF